MLKILVGSFLTFTALVATPNIARSDCSLTSLGVTPLSDSMLETYKGEPGGLYPGGFSTPPPEHETIGLEIASAVQPLDGNGEVDPINGKLVLVTFGMSNTAGQTDVFIELAENDPSINPQVVIVKGAQGGKTANDWTHPDQATWDEVDQRLGGAGVTPAQVQMGWLKQGLPGPDHIGEFPIHAEALQHALEDFARSALIRYPNLKIVYVSSRTRSYEIGEGLNPEPYAFESGFATRWMIENQINGSGDLNFDPEAGAVVAPYLLWGPYLWADGLDERSDGFVWECADVRSDDFTHPSDSGKAKVANQLVAFFKTHPTTQSWFLRSSIVGQPPECAPSADFSSGSAPLTVEFSANASDDGGIIETAWTFSDGTFSFDENPHKTFHAEDEYEAHVTVTDSEGNPTVCTKAIAVPEPASELAAYASLLALGLLGPRIRSRQNRENASFS